MAPLSLEIIAIVNLNLMILRILLANKNLRLRGIEHNIRTFTPWTPLK